MPTTISVNDSFVLPLMLKKKRRAARAQTEKPSVAVKGRRPERDLGYFIC